jgi:hypothetical protein
LGKIKKKKIRKKFFSGRQKKNLNFIFCFCGKKIGEEIKQEKRDKKWRKIFCR